MFFPLTEVLVVKPIMFYLLHLFVFYDIQCYKDNIILKKHLLVNIFLFNFVI